MTNIKLLENLSSDRGIINYLPGDIVMIYSATIPDGWLSCNGQSVSVSSYPQLYNAIGTYYGSSGSPATSFTIPDLNNQTSSFNKYPVGTTGNLTTWTAPTYNFHTHASDTAYLVDAVGDSIPIHNHTFAQSSTSETVIHDHAQVTATANSGWASASVDTANYSSSGTAGGTSDSNHTHPYTNYADTTVANAAHTHAVTGTVGISAVGSTHTHQATESVSFDSASHDYPSSFALRFVIKL